jgi:hypothetical protein
VAAAVPVAQTTEIAGVLGEAALVGDAVLVVDVLLPGVGATRQGSGTQVAVAVGELLPVGEAVLVVVAGTQTGSVVLELVPVLVVGGALVVVVGWGTWVVAGTDDVGAGVRGVTAGFLAGALGAGRAGRRVAGLIAGRSRP